MKATVLVIAMILIYRLLVLGACAYTVFWLGHSGWWFLLAIPLAKAGSWNTESSP